MGPLKSSQSRLKIVHLDHTGHAGGAELALKRTVSSQQFWDAVIITPQPATLDPDVYSSGIASHVSVKRVGRSQSFGVSTNRGGIQGILILLRDVLLQALLIRCSSEFREAHLVHANTSRAALYGSLAVLFTKKKLVVHLRDMVNAESVGSAGFWAFKNLILKRADGLIGNSEVTLKSALVHMPRRTIQSTVIPSPIGKSQPLPQLQNAWTTTTPAKLRVGMVARIDPWKGQELLLRAFASRFKGLPVELLFAGAPAFGHGEYLSNLRVLANELGVNDQVCFLGHLEEVQTFIDSLDVCVQSSIRPEPLGQNVLQYLAAGRAAVVANEGGPLEWVVHRQNGLLFEARSEISLADALQELVENDELRSVLGEAAAVTPGLMDDSAVAKKHFQFFQRILAHDKWGSRTPVELR